ncbi:SDR family oxidoreductase [Priestia sp. YIM B13446]|uniref:SDR family oxidoreductase n=1 Tax=Priestia TaxID=2800373 RepID=UPI00048C6CC5|nr:MULTISPECIES: SDR family oxidoreductase [Priestia]KWU59489.1 NAD-dependent dehydratase [Priestia megaterium]MBX9995128.1 SDR family oxidoreductase [Priestia aryabhattai]MCM3150424.1 SDR family oxidoreductase [Priestia megaterium]MCU7740601.1 SDR family oxidoreductase [Priestia megaterium]MDC7771885.1 SDR family oxidoreductase [Priestia megaterium]
MKVLVVGANGTTGKQVVEKVANSKQHEAYAMIRDEKQADALKKLGANVVLGDLEQDVSDALRGMDAVIFAAGSGGNTGDEKTIAVDQNGAKNIIDEAKNQGVKRFVMLSSMGTDAPEQGPEGLQLYLRAKAIADEYLKQSNLQYTIVRPGTLSNDQATGKIDINNDIEDKSQTIPRADVATVLVECLNEEATIGKTFEMLAGETEIEQAIKFTH